MSMQLEQSTQVQIILSYNLFCQMSPKENVRKRHKGLAGMVKHWRMVCMKLTIMMKRWNFNQL